MEIGTSEAEPIWTEFLRKLTRRGLRGVKLAVSDAHEGVKVAISIVLSDTWQRCRVEFTSCAMPWLMPARVADAWSQPSLQRPLPKIPRKPPANSGAMSPIRSGQKCRNVLDSAGFTKFRTAISLSRRQKLCRIYLDFRERRSGNLPSCIERGSDVQTEASETY